MATRLFTRSKSATGCACSPPRLANQRNKIIAHPDRSSTSDRREQGGLPQGHGGPWAPSLRSGSARQSCSWLKPPLSYDTRRVYLTTKHGNGRSAGIATSGLRRSILRTVTTCTAPGMAILLDHFYGLDAD